MEQFFSLLTLQAQLALLMIIGIWFSKKGIINDQGRKCLTDLVIDIILPCNILQSFRIDLTLDMLRSALSILIVSIVLQLFYGVFCAAAYNHYSCTRKAVLQYGTVCTNAAFLGNTIKSVSVCNTGMSMILIGAIIGSSDINLRNLLDRDTVLYCLIRLGIIPLLVLLACHVARVNDFVTIISVILSGMPMGGTTAILAEKYNGDSAFASKCVAVSTALSLITTPLWCLVA